MKVLSMTQPWATFAVMGLKDHETRGRSTSYRGPLLIHATKTPDLHFLHSPTGLAYALPDFWPSGEGIPLGAIIGACTLDNCIPTPPLPPNLSRTDYDFGDWSPGRYAWRLTNMVEFKDPIPCRGSVILWTPTPDVYDEVVEVLADDTRHYKRPPQTH